MIGTAISFLVGAGLYVAGHMRLITRFLPKNAFQQIRAAEIAALDKRMSDALAASLRGGSSAPPPSPPAP